MKVEGVDEERIIQLVMLAFSHEDEFLAKLPPERQPEAILAIGKMRSGLDKLSKFLEQVQNRQQER